MTRTPGLSARLKLTFSYAGLVMLAGSLLIAVAWIFALRWLPSSKPYPPPGGTVMSDQSAPGTSSNPVVLITGPSRSDLMHGFAPAAAVALLFLLALGLVGGWFLAGHMLAPLKRITGATRLAATGSLSHRIDLEGSSDEFRELADAFDTMLARLEAHVAEQQRFAANASHELRTPLAITQSLLEAARLTEHRDTGRLLDRLQTVNTRAIDLTEALLLLSRVNQRSFAREEVDLSLMAEEAVETLLPRAEKRGLTIETSGGVAPTTGSPALLVQLATNLVHNAIVHNLPQGSHGSQGTIWVTTRTDHDTVELTVENTGEKLTPDLVATLTEPFQRGTERIHTDHVGAGLGLAIVKSITAAHDGTLTLTARPAGGLHVAVRLPAAPRPPAVDAPEARYVPTKLRLDYVMGKSK